MADEEVKENTKRQLRILEKYIQVLEGSVRVVNRLSAHAVSHQLHKRAIDAVTAVKGLNGLIDELHDGQAKALRILGAKKVPIVIEKKLKLIKGGK